MKTDKLHDNAMRVHSELELIRQELNSSLDAAEAGLVGSFLFVIEQSPNPLYGIQLITFHLNEVMLSILKEGDKNG